ncbi:MAG: hypothetical protein JW863_23260 [Chitinispirillaceae bacterium]|nr:hypothetical protein [Chitinispirillaceae bacterium]
MTSPRNGSEGSALITTVFIIAVIVAFFLLLRGCLSQHDEYAIQGSAETFAVPHGTVTVFLKRHFVVNFYESDGGSTHISGTHRYYLETRDAATLKLLCCTKLKRPPKDKRSIPVVVGRDELIFWVYNGELVGFDPVSHAVICNADTLMSRNTVLRNNLPDEPGYYRYDYSLDRLVITTKDALKYVLNGDFTITPLEEVLPGKMYDFPEVKMMQSASELFREKRWDRNFPKENLIRLSDSIQTLQKIIVHKNDSLAAYKKRLARRPRGAKNTGSSRSDLMVSGVVIDSQLLVLESEQPENDRYYSFGSVFTNDVRNRLYRSHYQELNYHDAVMNGARSGEWEPLAPEQSFLNGGFLMNTETLLPIRLTQPDGWLICSTIEVGQKSPALITRISDEGETRWSAQLPAAVFRDMNVLPEGIILYVEGDKLLDEKSQIDAIFRIDLKTGDVIRSDVKMITVK